MKQWVDKLTSLYPQREARAIVRVVLEEVFGMTYTQMCAYGTASLTLKQRETLEFIINRLQKGEPVQYVTGSAPFGELTFKVTPATLIPRPETLELVRLAAESCCGSRVLDIGTGSGCIAVSLAAQHPDWQVYGCDISAEALDVARHNAQRAGADVHFFAADVLSIDSAELMAKVGGELHCVVSNPPYVCRSEASDMEPWVLEHEPHTALFVSDDDPLLFYRAIARHALTLLCRGGSIALETNTRFATQVAELLTQMGFAHCRVHDDQFGLPRHVTATLAS